MTDLSAIRARLDELMRQPVSPLGSPAHNLELMREYVKRVLKEHGFTEEPQ